MMRGGSRRVGRRSLAAVSRALAWLLPAVVLLTGCEPGGGATDGAEAYDFSVFFGTADVAETAAFLEVYAEESGLRVGAVFGGESEAAVIARSDAEGAPVAFAVSEAEAETLLASGDAADLAAVGDGFLARHMESVLPADFRLPGETVFLPTDFRGQGLAADSDVIADFFGETAAERFAEDWRAATFVEWTACVEAMDAYMTADEAPVETVLNGRRYRFLPHKSGALSALTGLFAFAGADKGIYGDAVMNAALSPVFSDAAGVEAFTAGLSREGTETLRAAMGGYVGALDALTSHLAGLYAPGIRGADLTSAKYYDRAAAYRMFAEDKAVFVIFDSEDRAKLTALNAAKAERLMFLPIKTAYGARYEADVTEVEADVADDTADTDADEGAVRNAVPPDWADEAGAATASAISVRVLRGFGIRADADAADRERAAEFLRRYSIWKTNGDAITAALITAGRGGAVRFPAEGISAESRERAFGTEGAREWLHSARWDAQRRADAQDYLTRVLVEGVGAGYLLEPDAADIADVPSVSRGGGTRPLGKAGERRSAGGAPDGEGHV